MAVALRSVAKALSSVSQIYKEINPATLSGAIDVIVVEQEDSSGEVKLACSPFHVRFGKLSVLRPVDRKVRVKVNGEEVPFTMRVGETGEAYFVFETDEDVPEDMVASPMSEAVKDEQMDDPAIDSLDLGPPQAALGSPPNEDSEIPRTSSPLPMPSTDAAPEPSDQRFGAPDDPNDENGQEANQGLFTSSAAKAGQLGKAFLGSATTAGKLTSVVDRFKSRNDVAEEDLNLSNEQVEELEGEMRDEAHSLAVDNHQEAVDNVDSARKVDAVGAEVRSAARDKARQLSVDERKPAFDHADLRSELSETSTGPHATSDSPRLDGRGPDIGPLPETSGHLLLDMSGYKVKDKDVGKVRETEEALLSGEFAHLSPDQTAFGDSQMKDDLLHFTQALLRSADLETTKAGSHRISEAIAEANRMRSPSPAHDPPTSSRHVRATSEPPPDIDDRRPPSPSPSEIEMASVGSLSSPSPYQFCLRTDELSHVFELALCAGESFGQYKGRDDLTFDQYRVTLQQLMETPRLVRRHEVVLKYNHSFMTWETASPVFVALARYIESWSKSAEEERTATSSTKTPSASNNEQNEVTSKWGRWWTRNRSMTALPPDTESQSLAAPPLSSTARQGSSDSTTAERPDTIHRAATAPAKLPEIATNALERLKSSKHYAKTLRLSSDQLKALNLRKGINTVTFSVLSSYSGVAKCTARIFFWETDFQVVVSDIDGTITKSDALGHVFTMIGRDWTHLGVAKLYTDIARNGYKMLYLTSRAIGQADTTREYLKGISQHGYQLPEGPVIMSPDRLMTSLHREVIMRKPEVFKMACLRDIAHLFQARNPFYAGFGNRITDALSYRSVDVPSSRIFTIDSYGEVKLELLELAGYKSSYIAINDLVDQMFPPINRKTAPDFTDFSFWRAPLPSFDLPFDLSPPSPTLSARSDTSMSRLRRFSGFGASASRKPSDASLRGEFEAQAGGRRSPRATSPLMKPAISISEDDDELDTLEGLDQAQLKQRLKTESMPGSYEEASVLAKRFRDRGAEVDEAGQVEDEEDLEAQSPPRYDDDEVAGEMDDLDLDFSSVPY